MSSGELVIVSTALQETALESFTTLVCAMISGENGKIAAQAEKRRVANRVVCTRLPIFVSLPLGILKCPNAKESYPKTVLRPEAGCTAL